MPNTQPHRPVTPAQPEPPVALALWRANSLLELAQIALDEGMGHALERPVAQVLGAPGFEETLAAHRSFFLPWRDLPLRELLLDRQAWQAIKRSLDKDQRRALLRACRYVIETAPPASASPPSARLPESFPALVDWLDRHGLTDVLDEHASVLLDRVGTEVFLNAGHHPSFLPCLGDLFTGEAPFVRRQSRPKDARAVRDAARLHIARRLEEATAAGREEAQRTAPPQVSDPILAELGQALLTLRRELRQLHAPVPFSQLQGRKLRLGLEPLEALFQPQVKLLSRARGGQEPEAKLVLEDWRNNIPLHCTCPTEDEGCRHVLAAVDVLLNILPQQGPLTADLARLLVIPRWGKVLAQVRQAGALHAAEPEELEGARLVWRLAPARGTTPPKLKPLVQRPARKGPGWTAGSAIGLSQLKRSTWSGVDRQDRAAAVLLDRYDGQDLLPEALELLAPTGRVFLDGGPDAPVRIAPGALGVHCQESETGFELVPGVEGRPADPGVVTRLAASSSGRALFVDLAANTCFVVRAAPAALAALELLRKKGAHFPKEAAQTLGDELGEATFPVSLPDHLSGRQVAPSVVPIVHLARPEPLALELEVCVRPLAGGLPFPVTQGPLRLRGRDGEERIYCQRDLDQERQAAQALLARLGLPAPEAGVPVRVEGDEALELCRRLEEEARAGLEVRWPPQRPRLSRSVQRKDLALRVTEGRDWFGLGGGAEVDGARVELAVLLEAAREKRRWVTAGDDQWVELSEELRARLEPLADVTFEGKHGPEVTLGAAPTLEALAEEVGAFEACASFRSLVDRIRQGALEKAAVPAALRVDLRPYQREGFEWLARLAGWGAGACLADDMGLGKTVQALGLLVHRSALGPALVVAPTSVCFNWEAEAARFAPNLRVISWRSCDRAEVVANLGPGDLLVASYGLLVRDLDKLREVKFATLVLDEAQAIKNAHALRARATRELQAEFRVALSGTPLENHLGELWSLFRTVLPGLLGSEEQFKQRFWQPIERAKDPRRTAALSRLLRPFLLRRTKAEVATELPPRTEVTLPVALSPAERRLYDDARLSAVAELTSGAAGGPEDRRFKVLAALTRLRLLACHPVLHDAGWQGPASKLSRFLELVEELRSEGHRALVFSQFVKHLAVVKEALAARGFRFQYLDGQTPADERRRRVEAFQAGEGELFLISLKAGGTGLNLTGADNVIHLDPWWNPAVEDQATDRAHRIGQTRPVTVYRLVTRGTLEEQILTLHAQKRELVAGVLDGSGTGARLEVEELVALLSDSARDEDGAEDEPAALAAELQAALNSEPEAEAEPHPAQKTRQGNSLGAQLLEAAGALDRVEQDFREWLEEGLREGRVGKGPVSSYPRAVGRFVAWLDEGEGLAQIRAEHGLEEIRALYLEQLKSGAWEAPASEPILARSALGKLAESLAGRQG
jgi:superfamily II DNA or RNA helicase